MKNDLSNKRDGGEIVQQLPFELIIVQKLDVKDSTMNVSTVNHYANGKR